MVAYGDAAAVTVVRTAAEAADVIDAADSVSATFADLPTVARAAALSPSLSGTGVLLAGVPFTASSALPPGLGTVATSTISSVTNRSSSSVPVPSVHPRGLASPVAGVVALSDSGYAVPAVLICAGSSCADGELSIVYDTSSLTANVVSADYSLRPVAATPAAGSASQYPVTFSATTAGLLLARACTDPVCGAFSSSTLQIASAAAGVVAATLAGDDSFPLVVFSSTTTTLSASQCTSSTCTAASAVTALFSTAATISRAAVTMGSDGQVYVAAATSSLLYVGVCTDTSCSTAITPSTYAISRVCQPVFAETSRGVYCGCQSAIADLLLVDITGSASYVIDTSDFGPATGPDSMTLSTSRAQNTLLLTLLTTAAAGSFDVARAELLGSPPTTLGVVRQLGEAGASTYLSGLAGSVLVPSANNTAYFDAFVA
jgi:hypothetical protein